MNIVLWEDPILKTLTQQVTRVNRKTVEALIPDFLDVLKANRAYGIAANQVGANYSLIALKPEDTHGLPEIMINPSVEHTSGPLVYAEEGCLSLPGLRQHVGRPAEVTVYWEEIDGLKQEQLFTDPIQSRVLQHEIDHLNGVMFFDHLSRQERRALLRKWK